MESALGEFETALGKFFRACGFIFPAPRIFFPKPMAKSRQPPSKLVPSSATRQAHHHAPSRGGWKKILDAGRWIFSDKSGAGAHPTATALPGTLLRLNGKGSTPSPADFFPFDHQPEKRDRKAMPDIDPEEKLDVRWIQRFQNYQRALGQLLRAIELSKQRPLTELERQGLVQAFEFTHELAWKTLKDFLEDRGSERLYGSRDASRSGFAAGLLADGDVWMRMIASRNQTSHTYNEEAVEEICTAVIGDYAQAFVDFQKRFETLARHPQ
jgi:nucleotidyltransferase substrate binding protein (TIGR01987 family)